MITVNFQKPFLEKSQEDFEDDFVRRLQDTIAQIKSSREMEEQYMLMEELLKDERTSGKAEGKAEAVLELLGILGSVPDELVRQINNERDISILSKYLRLAARAQSIEEFSKAVK